MARNTLAVEYMTPATQVQVYRLNNGSFIALGNPFTPSNGMVTNASPPAHTNLAVEFGGDFYVNVAGDVRKLDPSTDNWVAETLPAVTLDANVDFTGFFIGWSSAGIPRLCWALRTNTNLARTMYLELGGAWTLGAPGPIVTQTAGQGPSGRGMFRNTFHTSLGGNESHNYDVATDSWGVQFLGQNSRSQFVRARGRFFMLRTTSENPLGGFLDIHEFIGGVWVLIIDGSIVGQPMLQDNGIGYPLSSGGNSADGFAAFYDQAADKIIIVAYEDLGTVQTRGMKVLSVDPDTRTVVDLTTPVAPAALRYNTTAPSAVIDARIRIQVDNETNPLAQTVSVWIEIADGQYEGFAYANTTTTMTSLGTGGGREIALAHDVIGGGEFFYEGSTTADPYRSVFEVQARVPIPGGTRMFFTAWVFDETGGAPATTDLTLAIYYNKSAQGLFGKPGALASISAVAKVSGPGSAPVLSAGKVNNVTPDGTTVYSVDWNAVGAAQVADGEFHQLMPRVEV